MKEFIEELIFLGYFLVTGCLILLGFLIFILLITGKLI